MPLEEIIPTCNACGTPMVLREKDGSKFWGCKNWRQCKGKTIPYGKEPPKAKPQDVKSNTGDQMIMEELAGINKRLDKLGEFLLEKLK